VAGKTGTSNEEKDAWFIGYAPDLAVGVYVGYDNPKPMGKGRTGGELAAPIVADFMRLALREQPATPFRVPRAIAIVPGAAKRAAIRAALRGPVTTACPASVLRRHRDATLFLDEASAAGLD
jgi:penicillin-binding protein 1A